jgi:hypothetical protein
MDQNEMYWVHTCNDWTERHTVYKQFLIRAHRGLTPNSRKSCMVRTSSPATLVKNFVSSCAIHVKQKVQYFKVSSNCFSRTLPVSKTSQHTDENNGPMAGHIQHARVWRA